MPRFVSKTVARADQVQRLMKVAFPDYRRKTVRVVPATSVTLTDLNWSGGTRSEYRSLRIDRDTGTITCRDVGDHISHPANNRDEGSSFPLELSNVVVRAGTFCGKPSHATVYVRPEDIESILGFAVAADLLEPVQA